MKLEDMTSAQLKSLYRLMKLDAELRGYGSNEHLPCEHLETECNSCVDCGEIIEGCGLWGEPEINSDR